MKKEYETDISYQIESALTKMVQPNPDKVVHQIDDTHFQIKEQGYELVMNYREGFQLEAFEQRYQDIFDKYDFIVGDWGFNQLRLKGFYQMGNRRAFKEQMIDTLDDYLKEYCNFGCAYFVLAKDVSLERYRKLQKVMEKGATSTAKDTSKRPKVTTKDTHFKKTKKPKGAKAGELREVERSFTQKKRQPEEKQVPHIEPVTSSKKGNFVIKQKKG